MAFHLVISNMFIHVVPRLHKVIVDKIAHYFLIQLNEKRLRKLAKTLKDSNSVKIV